ncbi:hypothetical protein ABXJ56_01240 [Microbacterium chocolatum]|uniref:hypothetical protein n=1 Tax=Microbacterium aurantiacum TaxID=162393 RepID=UPI00338EB6A5
MRRTAWVIPAVIPAVLLGLLLVSINVPEGERAMMGAALTLLLAWLIGFWLAAVAASLALHRRWRRLLPLADTVGAELRPVSWEWFPMGVLGSRGTRGWAPTVLAFPDGTRIGEWEYVRTFSGARAHTAHVWGFISLPAAVIFPHLVLDATANVGLHSLRAGAALDQSQRLRLEGDFGEHFHAYAPLGYETAALYFLTPDVMVDLLDGAAGWDVEFIGSRVLFFRPGHLLSLRPGVIEGLISFQQGWASKIARWTRWTWWRDDRLTTGVVVHPDGRITVPPVGVDVGGRRVTDERGGRIGLAVYVVCLLAPPVALVVVAGVLTSFG